MNISSWIHLLINFFFFVTSSLFFVVIIAAHDHHQDGKQRASVSHRPRLVNMSRLLYIPPQLQRRYKIPELVDSSLPQQQREIASTLKKWASDQLLCEGHAKDSDKCLDQKEAIENAFLKDKSKLDINKIIKPHTYLCSADSVHAWNILGAIFIHRNAKDVVKFGEGVNFNKMACLGQALKCNPTYASAWFNIAHQLQQTTPGVGTDLEFFSTGDAEEKVYTKHFTREDCLVQTVNFAPWHSDAWFALGMSIMSSTNDTYIVVGQKEGQKRTKRDCYVQAIENSVTEQHHSLFAYWNNLGNVLDSNDPNDKVFVNGESYSKLDCYKKVVKLNPDFSIGWFNLGAAMNAGENDNGEPVFSKQGALLRALSSTSNAQEENALNNNPVFWINLGDSIPFTVGSSSSSSKINEKNFIEIPLRFSEASKQKKFSKKDCYIKALEIDGSIASAWNNLGTVLEISSSSRATFIPGPGFSSSIHRANDKNTFSKKNCFIEAIRHSSSSSSPQNYVEALAWQNLADILGLDSLMNGEGKVHTNSANFADLLGDNKQDDHEESSSASTVTSDFVEIEGKKYNKRRCFAEIIRILDKNFVHGDKENNNIYIPLSPSAKNTLSYSWTELGVIAYKENKKYRNVKVGNNKRFTSIDCFARATQIDADNFRAWYNLGVILGNTTIADIKHSISNSHVVVAPKNRLDALCDPHLHQQNKDDSENSNNINKYFYRQCFVQSLKANPLHCASWNALGNSLNRPDRLREEPEDVVVLDNGRIIKKREAYLQAVQCGERFMRNNFTKDDALLQHTLSISWFNLGTTLKDKKEDTISLSFPELDGNSKNNDDDGEGEEYNMQDCFIQSIQYDATNADAWYNLGLTLELNDKIIIRPFLVINNKNDNKNSNSDGDGGDEKTGYEVDRKLCFESYDAIVNGGRIQDLLIESGVKITSLNEIGTTRRAVLMKKRNNHQHNKNVVKLKKEEKFVDEEDDDDDDY